MSTRTTRSQCRLRTWAERSPEMLPPTTTAVLNIVSMYQVCFGYEETDQTFLVFSTTRQLGALTEKRRFPLTQCRQIVDDRTQSLNYHPRHYCKTPRQDRGNTDAATPPLPKSSASDRRPTSDAADRSRRRPASATPEDATQSERASERNSESTKHQIHPSIHPNNRRTSFRFLGRHCGNTSLYSGSSRTPRQVSSFGVPNTWKILNN